MDSITELPDKANTLAQESSTLSDTSSNQTDLMPKAPTPSPTSTRRKGSIKTAPPFSMKRAASTPNVRSMAGAEALAASIAEKRRNKLGYHRTSVACGHCRRRKIRCLLAPEDPQGKCQNCIRLKKDCNFFPVEQHPESDDRPRSESKLDVMSNEAGTSDSSSPSFSGSRGAEHIDDPNYRLQHLPSSGGHYDVQIVETLSRSLTNPPSRGPSSSRTFDPFPSFEQNETWTTPYIQQSPQSMPMDKLQPEDLPFWRPPGPSLPTSYPQHPFSVTHSSGSFVPSSQSRMDHTPSFGHRGPHDWSASPNPVPRSMSLVGPDDLPIHYQNQYFHDAPNEFQSNMNSSDMQPPTLSSNNSTTSGSNPPLPLSGMGLYHEPAVQNMNYVYPPTWSSIPQNHNPQMPASAPERFTQGWYPDPSVLVQVKEDESGPHFQHPPHPGYLPHQANPG